MEHGVQLERRQQKGREEGFRIRNTGKEAVFSTFDVHSPSGRTYGVTIRSLTRRVNSCQCPDFRTNLLGTCKHVEATLALLTRKLSGRVEDTERWAPPLADIYLRYDEEITVVARVTNNLKGTVRALVERYFDGEGRLVGDVAERVPALVQEIEGLKVSQKARIRIGPDVLQHASLLVDWAAHDRQRAWFLGEVEAGRRSLDVVGTKLYPYQVEGMLHLATKGRALLADDMGLGKTLEAIAAALMLRELRGIRRVLVVTPASLKHQWAREIRRFTSVPVEVVGGPSSKRDQLYREPSFFTLVNYELLLRDARMFESLGAELIILDEAQRIKNWRTKTAQVVKDLKSRFVFVLTGTPLENNLDELYSLMQVVDSRLLGPLWQFNSRYFQLERRASGSYKVLGLKNLDELRKRLAPVLLRRTRQEVLSELPPRVDSTFLVPMTPAQLEPYEEFRQVATHLASIAERRPLTPSEHKRLMMALQKMRVICDALELHDPGLSEKVRGQTAPKLTELAGLLEEQIRDAGRKAVVFSSFEGMIDLAIERCAKPLNLGYVKLAGSVPTSRRGGLLDRFREDPDCKLFFSTDAGGVGLNLQTASLVINLDLPWNPAVLEQRIGRAHRMGQSNPVQVINLVAQGVLEERMLDTLAAKRQVFHAVLGSDAGDELVFEKNRGLLARLRVMLSDEESVPKAPEALLSREASEERAEPAVTPASRVPLTLAEQVQTLADRLAQRLGGRLLLVRQLAGPSAAALPASDLPRVLVVVDQAAAELSCVIDEVTQGLSPDGPRLAVHLFDRSGFEALTGLLGATLTDRDRSVEAFRAPSLPATTEDPEQQRLRAVRDHLDAAQNRLSLARHLASGGFPTEAAAPLRQALDGTLKGLFRLAGDGALPDCTAAFAIHEWLVKPGMLSVADSARVPWALSLLEARRPDGSPALEPGLVEDIAVAIEQLAETGRTRLAAAQI